MVSRWMAGMCIIGPSLFWGPAPGGSRAVTGSTTMMNIPGEVCLGHYTIFPGSFTFPISENADFVSKSCFFSHIKSLQFDFYPRQNESN